MAIKDIMSKFRSSDEYMELEPVEEARQESRLSVQVERLDTYTDSERIQRKLREGSIMLVSMKQLRQKDAEELKRAVEKIKRTCMAINGDIAGISDDWLVVTPPAARIHREAVAE